MITRQIHTRSARWFTVAFVIGFLLGVLLLVRAFVIYRYVASDLVPDYLAQQAQNYVSTLEERARTAEPADWSALERLLEEMRNDQREEVTWIRVADQQGRIVSRTAAAPDVALDQEISRSLVGIQTPHALGTRRTPQGDALIVALPFRFRLSASRGEPVPPPGSPGPNFMLAEVALALEGSANPFRPLQRSLAVVVATAIALMAAMATGAIVFPSYARGKQLERQLAVAREVQQELLPKECEVCPAMEFAATCLPAGQVGCDYYDVFVFENGRIVMALGDVSGKGLPAALLMALVHGAVRTVLKVLPNAVYSEVANHLNELLRARTAEARYVTLFLGEYDPVEQTLRYVNAGHPPPLLLRAAAGSLEPSVERLQAGGPVLGLLSGAAYEQGEVELKSGDLLILYSDGVSEAANAVDVEFGEERLLGVALQNRDGRAAVVLREIVSQVQSFVGGAPPRDDLTLLVGRVASPSTS